MRSLIALAALLTSSPAMAQDHSTHAQQPAKEQPADPHAGHQMPAPAPKPAADPHAGHAMPTPAPEPEADPHAGHAMPALAQPTADPHAGHNMGAMAASDDPPVLPTPPAALSGPAHAADTVFGTAAMDEAREELIEGHGQFVTQKILFDRAELRFGDEEAWAIEAEAWIGDDEDKLWLKADAEGGFGEAAEALEGQLLYSRAVAPFWNLQGGVRYDLRPNPDRGYAVFGVKGVAPYWFEIDAAAFLSEKGYLSARFEAELDQRITQRLILQPSIEFDLAASADPAIGQGAGLVSAEAGLRLRYEFTPEFAPYVGINYERSFGDTADFARAAGDDVDSFALLVGLRAWL
ncbi:copper resistance protein B [Sphingomicrobium flavum]|uniref:copper resistance protein B n=1 Tax=Sphingomicrobium flavum TaxID=1229164 RepID=UPI0021AD675E|nr:copper resistance protein B [Sphingomicrobium flavum]